MKRLLLLVFVCLCSSARADTFVLQGSTTFNDCLITQYRAEVEEQSHHKLTVIPNKTIIGLVALIERQADFAMTSTAFDVGKAQLVRQNPDFPVQDLRAFEIARTRMALAVNSENPVASITLDVLRSILTGDIRNWREIGGLDQPIRVVFVRDGGGVQASVEDQVLDGRPITAPDQIRVQTSAQVTKIVEQEPGALGLAQLKVVRASAAKELTTDHVIEQRLSLITLGEPSPSMNNVIETMRRVAALTTQ